MKTAKIIILVLITMTACSKNSENKYLTKEWAIDLHNNPGHQKQYGQKQKFIKKSKKLFFAANKLQRIDCQKAISKYEEALELYADGSIYYNYGICLSKMKRFKQAVSAYENSILLNYKKSYLSYYNIACAYSLLKKQEKSFKIILKAVETGYYAVSYLKKDSDLKYLRTLKEWDSWYKKYADRYQKLEPAGKEVRELVPTFGVNVYSFCDNNIKLCYHDRDGETSNCKIGTWKKQKNIISFHFTKEEGRKGVGETLKVATADAVYKKYEKYEKAIDETKSVDWSDVLNDIADNDSYDQWEYIKENKNCSK